MITYLVNLTEQNCKEINHQFALDMGCTPPTIYWFNMWKHPELTLWLLAIDEEHKYLLTQEQQNLLVSYGVIEAEGWIQPSPFPPN